MLPGTHACRVERLPPTPQVGSKRRTDPDEDADRTLTVEKGFPGHPRLPGNEGRAWPTRGAPLG